MRRRLLALAALIIVVVTGAARAHTYVVDGGGTGDYTDIQPALTAAVTGDTVLVLPGTYVGEYNTILNFGGEDIVLKAAGGARSVTIDGQGSRYAFWFSHNETPAAIVEGFTVVNGYEYSGGAVYCSESSPTFVDCTFSGCTAEYGGAVYVWTASPSFTGCTFSSNDAPGDGWGGAVYAEHCQSVFTDCTFSDNSSAHFGGAIHCNESSPTLIGCAFTGNSAVNHGGSLYCTGSSSPSVSGCTFSSCSAGIGSAAYTAASSAPTFTDCGFYDCTGGSPVYCENGSPTFTDCSFGRNSAAYSGGVYLYDSQAEFTSCLFWDNTCSASHRGGGALYCDSAAPTLTSCTFSDNGAEGIGGTVHCWGGSPAFENCIIAFGTSGPAVDCDDSRANDPVLSCSDVYGNAGGDWVGCIAAQSGADNNMNEDPQFCGRPGRDYRLYDTSPCAPAQIPVCGLVGALDVACDSPVEASSWGAVKAMYR